MHGAGRPALAVWAVAFAVLSECLIVQTSLAPGGSYDAEWGRALGANRPYLVWASGYESGWAVLLGLQLTGLVFAGWRMQPWRSGRGMWAVAAVIAVGAAWTSHRRTHVVAPQFPHRPV